MVLNINITLILQHPLNGRELLSHNGVVFKIEGAGHIDDVGSLHVLMRNSATNKLEVKDVETAFDETQFRMLDHSTNKLQ